MAFLTCSAQPEDGYPSTAQISPFSIRSGLTDSSACWVLAPAGTTALASSTASPVAAFESTEKQLYGIQFHPEVVHTPYGQDVLKRFLGDVCGCAADWSTARRYWTPCCATSPGKTPITSR